MTEKFWLLRNGYTEHPAELVSTMDLPPPAICPVDPDHRMSRYNADTLSVALSSTRVKDIVWTWGSDLLVQDHVLTFLRSNGITGFTANKADVRFKNRSAMPPPRLWEILVTGWGGMAREQAGIELVKSCPGCGYRKYSIAHPTRLVDPDQWDGSDFFMVWPLPAYFFLSDRAASLLKHSGYKGFKLIPATQINVKPGETVTPGSLSFWMPADRAMLLGGPLGIA